MKGSLMSPQNVATVWTEFLPSYFSDEKWQQKGKKRNNGLQDRSTGGGWHWILSTGTAQTDQRRFRAVEVLIRPVWSPAVCSFWGLWQWDDETRAAVLFLVSKTWLLSGTVLYSSMGSARCLFPSGATCGSRGRGEVRRCQVPAQPLDSPADVSRSKGSTSCWWGCGSRRSEEQMDRASTRQETFKHRARCVVVSDGSDTSGVTSPVH